MKSPDSDATTQRSAELLTVLAGPQARLRDDQAEAIGALVDDHARVLLVQATGWGKSAVYWIATALRRAQGAGPTLVVSPLLALMRNQVSAAGRLGLSAATINSANAEEWDAITTRLDNDEIDVLLISPERLNAASFRPRLGELTSAAGLLVIDEAHCISDWGHDFRPDYRRIRDVLAGLGPDVPVLACTATANQRVTADVAEQLSVGSDSARTMRGDLGRASLRLAVHDRVSSEERLAFLTAFVRKQRSTHGLAGVIYTLTIAEAQTTADFLTAQGLTAMAYSSAIDASEREELEARLAENQLDCLVATSALGMGYDKPDLAFVVHLGSPSSPVTYYQQVGRAGRAIDTAEVLLMPTGSQEDLWKHFDIDGVPSRRDGMELLDGLADGPASVAALERAANMGRSRIELMLKVLDVDGVVTKDGAAWRATGKTWDYDEARFAHLITARKAEHASMRALCAGEITSCLMAFLRTALGDTDSSDCGRCQSCTGWTPVVDVDPNTTISARRFLRRRDVLIRPRQRWPAGLPHVKGAIKSEQRPEEGRALAGGDDSGWGIEVEELLRLAAGGQAEDPRYSELVSEVVEGLTTVLARWKWSARPGWITVVPSLDEPAHTRLAGDIAERLAQLGRLSLVHTLHALEGPPQRDAANSVHKAGRALKRLSLAAQPPDGPVLAVAAATESRWTVTVAAHYLNDAAAGRIVLPLALRSR